MRFSGTNASVPNQGNRKQLGVNGDVCRLPTADCPTSEMFHG
jgi:hypothetical protein